MILHNISILAYLYSTTVYMAQLSIAVGINLHAYILSIETAVLYHSVIDSQMYT